jgi:hypothetical protein
MDLSLSKARTTRNTRANKKRIEKSKKQTKNARKEATPNNSDAL